MACPHLHLKKCVVGETIFYKCETCKLNFTIAPLQIAVTYPPTAK